MVSDHAVGLLEYGLMIGLIAVVAIAAAQGISPNTREVFDMVATEFPQTTAAMTNQAGLDGNADTANMATITFTVSHEE